MRRAVTVTVADSHAAAVDDVAAQLAQAGMQVERVLAVLGVVTGSVDDARLAALERVPGVAGVEEQTTFRLPPPGADVQ